MKQSRTVLEACGPWLIACSCWVYSPTVVHTANVLHKRCKCTIGYKGLLTTVQSICSNLWAVQVLALHHLSSRPRQPWWCKNMWSCC